MAYKLRYSDYSTPSGPPNPAEWVGPPGPPGPVGPQGPQGIPGVAGNSFPEAPNDGSLYGRGGATVAWSPVLPLAGGTVTGVLAAPTPPPGTNTTQVATTAFVTTATAGIVIPVPAGGSIQAAHDALPSTGGSILLSANTTYAVAAQINITKPNVRLSAPSWGTVLQRPAGFTPAALINATGTNCVIEGFTVDGNAVVGTHTEVGASGNASIVRNLHIINSAGTTSLGLTGQNSRATGNTITGLGVPLSTQRGYGIWAIGHTTVMIDHNVITGTGIDGIGFDGDGTQIIGNEISGCHCWNTSGGGQIASYYVTLGSGVGSRQCVVGNTIGPPGNLTWGTGIEAWNPGMIISGNSFDGIKAPAISIAGNGITVTGNSVRNCGGSFDAVVVLGGITDFLISGNRIADDQTTPTMRYGVSIYAGASDRYTITGNLITGNTGAAIFDAGTGTNKTIVNNQGNNDIALPRTGGALSGGLGFGSAFAASNTDITRHIALYGTNNGIGVVNARINYVASVGVTHSFVVNAADVGAFGATGLNGCALGATTPSSAAVTTLSASGLANFAAGVTLNNSVGSSSADFSKGVGFTATSGIGYTAGRINVVAVGTGATYFVSGSTDVASIWSDGLHLVKGFGAFGSTIPATKPTVTGAKGSNAALASLLTALASYGLVTDSTTA